MHHPHEYSFADRIDFYELMAASAAALPGDSTQAFMIDRLAIASLAHDRLGDPETTAWQDQTLPNLLTRLVNRWRMRYKVSTDATTADPDAGRNAISAVPFRRVHSGPAKRDVSQGK